MFFDVKIVHPNEVHLLGLERSKHATPHPSSTASAITRDSAKPKNKRPMLERTIGALQALELTADHIAAMSDKELLDKVNAQLGIENVRRPSLSTLRRAIAELRRK